MNGSPRARTWLLVVLLAFGVAQAAVPIYKVDVVKTYPHDPGAFTEGLFYLNGYFYESTGLEQHSSIRKVEIETGKVLQQVDIPPQYFGEGIVNWGNRIVSLTWKNQLGFVFDLRTLKLRREFHYEGEGWALTQDGRRIIMSDGTPELRFLDPDTLVETGRLSVTLEGKPVRNVNELEWVRGEIFANVWETNWIIRIDPSSGHVKGLIDLRGLRDSSEGVTGIDSVLNGIAYDAKNDRLFVTGKNWSKIYEITIQPSRDSLQDNR